MKKRRCGGSMFLGVFFLLLGVSIILKTFFHIEIPLVKSLFAFFLIYLGIKILFGSFGVRISTDFKEENSAIFAEKKWAHNPSAQMSQQNNQHNNKYNVVFGSSQLDLTSLDLLKLDSSIEVNCVFGEMLVLIKEDTPIKITANSVFAEAKMPDGNMVAFGTLNFDPPKASGKSSDQSSDQASDKSSNLPVLKINGNVVFGSLKFQYVK